MPALVQHLGDTAVAATFANTIQLSISKTVTVGNKIFVAASNMVGNSGVPTGATDNLGNTYSVVEANANGTLVSSGLLVAPVTNGGTLTTITVTFAVSSDNRAMSAAEFSGVAALSVAGGASSGTSATPTWVVNKTIPAGGIAIGAFGSYTDRPSTTAGSASGSPSTSISLDTLRSGTPTVALAYAIAGGSAVTGFSGTVALGGSNEWAAAGGVYDGSSTAPTWVSPADTVSMGTTPTLEFTSPTAATPQHFWLELDTVNTFDSGNLRTLRTDQSQTGWEYWNGSAWTAFPSTGLPSGSSGNNVRHTVQTALSATTWYRRVRAGV